VSILAKKLFLIAYGDQCDTAGAGRRIVLDERRLTIDSLPVRQNTANE